MFSYLIITKHYIFMEKFNKVEFNDFISYIKNVKYKNKIKTLNIVLIDNVITINEFELKKSQIKLGYGSSILNDITKYCDDNSLITKVKYDKNNHILYEFYKKNNFNLKNDELIYKGKLKK